MRKRFFKSVLAIVLIAVMMTTNAFMALAEIAEPETAVTAEENVAAEEVIVEEQIESSGDVGVLDTESPADVSPDIPDELPEILEPDIVYDYFTVMHEFKQENDHYDATLMAYMMVQCINCSMSGKYKFKWYHEDKYLGTTSTEFCLKDRHPGAGGGTLDIYEAQTEWLIQDFKAEDLGEYRVEFGSISASTMIEEYPVLIFIAAGDGGSVDADGVQVTEEGLLLITDIFGGTSVETVDNQLNIESYVATATAAEGYEFAGWQGIPESGKAEESLTITAAFKKIEYFDIEVHSDKECGTVSTESVKDICKGTPIKADGETLYIGEGDKQIAVTAVAVDGYEFAGWQGIPESGKIEEDVTLYARWTEKTYTITYELDGGTNSDKNPADYTVTAPTITLASPKKTGYTFAGWYSDGEFKTKVTEIKEGSTENKTFYAKWTPVKYTVVFKANGATSGTMEKQSRTYDDEAALTANKFKRTGYTFTGWNTKADGSGDDVKNKSKLNLRTTAGTRTLYAQWTLKTYTITYELNDGTNSSKNPADYTVTASTITLASPKKTGYTFAGWYSDSAFKTKVTEIKEGSTGNKTFYAKWTPVEYTVVFKANGATSGTMEKQSRTYDDEAALTANKFKRTGYTFTGWNTKADGSGDDVKNKSKSNLRTTAGTRTLYAQWTLKTYTITYELNGGTNSGKNPADYTVTASTITLASPKKTGYTFVGWYSDSEFKTKVTEIKTGSTGNKTFYAKWKKK